MVVLPKGEVLTMRPGRASLVAAMQRLRCRPRPPHQLLALGAHLVVHGKRIGFCTFLRNLKPRVLLRRRGLTMPIFWCSMLQTIIWAWFMQTSVGEVGFGHDVLVVVLVEDVLPYRGVDQSTCARAVFPILGNRWHHLQLAHGILLLGVPEFHALVVGTRTREGEAVTPHVPDVLYSVEVPVRDPGAAVVVTVPDRVLHLVAGPYAQATSLSASLLHADRDGPRPHLERDIRGTILHDCSLQSQPSKTLVGDETPIHDGVPRPWERPIAAVAGEARFPVGHLGGGPQVDREAEGDSGSSPELRQSWFLDHEVDIPGQREDLQHSETSLQFVQRMQRIEKLDVPSLDVLQAKVRQLLFQGVPGASPTLRWRERLLVRILGGVPVQDVCTAQNLATSSYFSPQDLVWVVALHVDPDVDPSLPRERRDEDATILPIYLRHGEERQALLRG
mmetsp:Transcript_78447/g.197077  ORF Transcript_78447/g.197077 Transcript_78447/m.197077 type:complete len:447 (+) Transcript_78447:744-2084(+)